MRISPQLRNWVDSELPRVGIAYRRLRDRLTLMAVPRMTEFGFRFSGDSGMLKGVHEPEEIELIKALFPEVDLLVNVGANIGLYCCLACQAGKKVVAFEPVDLNLRQLYRNLEANGWTQDVEIFPVALAGRSELKSLYGGGKGASLLQGWAQTPERYCRTVPVSTLDRILADAYQGMRLLVVIDVEGAEYEVLLGAVRTLERNPKPIWVMEICIKEQQPPGIGINPNLYPTFKMFWTYGYVAYTADKHQRQIDEEEIQAICRTEVDTLGTHNFLFVANPADQSAPVPKI